MARKPTLDGSDTPRAPYRTTAPILHDGCLYAPGMTIDLTDAQAAELVGAIDPNPIAPTGSADPMA